MCIPIGSPLMLKVQHIAANAGVLRIFLHLALSLCFADQAPLVFHHTAARGDDVVRAHSSTLHRVNCGVKTLWRTCGGRHCGGIVSTCVTTGWFHLDVVNGFSLLTSNSVRFRQVLRCVWWASVHCTLCRHVAQLAGCSSVCGMFLPHPMNLQIHRRNNHTPLAVFVRRWCISEEFLKMKENCLRKVQVEYKYYI